MDSIVIGSEIYYFNDGTVRKESKDNGMKVLTEHLVTLVLVHSEERYCIAYDTNSKYNLFDRQKFCYVFDHWYNFINYFVSDDGRRLNDCFRVEREDGFNVYDVSEGRFLLPRWYDRVSFFDETHICIGMEYNRLSLYDLTTRTKMNRLWYWEIEPYDDQYVMVMNEKSCYNLVELSTGHHVSKKWVQNVFKPSINPQFALLYSKSEGGKCIGIFSFQQKRSLFGFDCGKIIRLTKRFYLIEELKNAFYDDSEERTFWIYDFKTCQFISNRHYGIPSNNPKIINRHFLLVEYGGYNLLDLNTGKLAFPTEMLNVVPDFIKGIYKFRRMGGEENIFSIKECRWLLDKWYDDIQIVDNDHVLVRHSREKNILSIKTGKPVKLVEG